MERLQGRHEAAGLLILDNRLGMVDDVSVNGFTESELNLGPWDHNPATEGLIETKVQDLNQRESGDISDQDLLINGILKLEIFSACGVHHHPILDHVLASGF